MWSSGTEPPVAAVDGDGAETPVVVLASATTSLEQLQLHIWSAMQTRVAHYFPGVTERNVRDAVRVCYRLDETSPWTPLNEPLVQIEPANKDTVCVDDLQLETRDYRPGKDKFHHLLIETRYVDAEIGGADWRHGRFYSSVLANEWRFKIKVGDMLDAKDTDKKWCDC